MHDKMKDPECVTHKVKIAPPDYSEENYLATFTPQRQLTPEQIFWSQDIIKMKAKALKEQTSASRPTKVLTVYLPNTHATLVPRVLPTKIQIDSIDEIKRNNLLIANDNLIADCLFKDVFHVATNSELNVFSFTEMHDAHTSFKAPCLERKMKASIQGKDNAIKKLRTHISQLNETRSEAKKINVLQEQNELFRAENGKIKQHYKELYDSIKITRAKHLEESTALLTENESLKIQIQIAVVSNKESSKLKVLAPGKYAVDVEPISPRN
ncbi:hypothetical protein Tco_0707950 [Tanacetum coccineum]